MKLIEAYISSFGKLKDYTYNFSDGINTINQENGWGKSTFACFIKCMFYGIKDGKRSIEENERTKYKPWNSTEKFGGYVVFEWAGKSYKIERFFGNKQSEDTVRLFDLATGKEYPSAENWGNRIFGIDEDGFLSTTYFSEKDFEIKSNTSLTAKFNEVCELDDSENFDKALLTLENKLKKYSYSGNRGLIPESKSKLFDINNRIEKMRHSFLTVEKLKEEVAITEKEISSLKQKETLLRENLDRINRAEAQKLKRENYDRLIGQREEYIERIENAKRVLNGNNVNEERILNVKECLSQLNAWEQKKQYLKEDIDKINADSARVKTGKTNVVFWIISAILFIASVVSFLNNPVLGACITALFLVSVVLILILGKNKTQYGDILKEKISEYEKYEKTCSDSEKQMAEYFSEFNLNNDGDFLTSLSEIERAYNTVKETTPKISEIEKEIEAVSENKDLSAETEIQESAFNLTQKLKAINEEREEKNRELSNKYASIRWYEGEIDQLGDLESEKSELAERIAEYERQSEILDLTVKCMKQASETLKVRYREPLMQSVNKYLKYIAKKEMQAVVDTDLKVELVEKGIERSSEYYSKGYKNLFEICKRFALTDILYTKEKPFIILDDPFYNLDDEKIKSSLELLKSLSNEYQIVYMVCHNSRVIN